MRLHAETRFADNEYEVYALHAFCSPSFARNHRGLLVLVEWRNAEWSWEPVENLKNAHCDSLLRMFRQHFVDLGPDHRYARSRDFHRGLSCLRVV